MKRFIYQISWKENVIYYDPIFSTIVFPKTKRTLKIIKDNINYFPDNRLKKNSITDINYFPTILTIFQGTDCNLSCKYCYADDKNNHEDIDLQYVSVISKLIVENCKRNKLPFILGFRGSNEPLLKPELIKSCFKICKEIAEKSKVKFYTHTITNGVIPKETAIWASKNINEILLSWDGYENIHNENRIFPNGKPSFEYVRNSADIFLKSNFTKLKVRATITKSSENKLLEIAKYFKEVGIKYLDFNPLYQNENNSVNSHLFPDKVNFVRNFIIARNWAKNNKIDIEFAGTRLNTIHDKQCGIFQKNYAITPDNYLTACFQATQNYNNKNEKYIFGNYNKLNNSININWEKLNSLYGQLSETYEQCANCFNILHCNKNCPDICPLRDNYKNFDCTILKWIGISNILEQSGYKYTDNDIENIESFYSNISIKQLTI
jgi:radical SAM protein with 4Fe4S-binding SPASM domain